MKLICPNCQAQYEIPDVAIPDSGRDVQCANCDETWFQKHPENETDTDQSDTGQSDTAQSTAADDDTAHDPEASAPEASAPEGVAPEADGPEASDPKTSDLKSEAEPMPPRRDLSPAVTDILRQEAAREKDARSAKLKEPDGGLKSSSRSRPGRERLPDIHDVNVSNPRLKADTKAEDVGDIVFDVDTDPPEAPRKTGFKRGFSMMVILVGLALALYIFAPQLAQKFPSLQEPLTQYLDAVNSGRVWLSEWIADLTK